MDTKTSNPNASPQDLHWESDQPDFGNCRMRVHKVPMFPTTTQAKRVSKSVPFLGDVGVDGIEDFLLSSAAGVRRYTGENWIVTEGLFSAIVACFNRRLNHTLNRARNWRNPILLYSFPPPEKNMAQFNMIPQDKIGNFNTSAATGEDVVARGASWTLCLRRT